MIQQKEMSIDTNIRALDELNTQLQRSYKEKQIHKVNDLLQKILEHIVIIVNYIPHISQNESPLSNPDNILTELQSIDLDQLSYEEPSHSYDQK